MKSEDISDSDLNLLYLKAQMFDVLITNIPKIADNLNQSSIISKNLIPHLNSTLIYKCCDHFIDNNIKYKQAVNILKKIWIKKAIDQTKTKKQAAKLMGISYPLLMAWKKENENAKKAEQKNCKNSKARRTS